MKAFFKNRWFWGLVISLLVCFLLVNRFRGSKSTLQLGSAIYSELLQKVTVAGVVYANHKTVISAPYNGYIKKFYVKIGDLVQAGDPIVSVVQSLRGGSEDVYPMRAPFAGTVVQVLRTEGEYVESTNQNNAIVRIDDLSRLYVEANVPEVEVGKLKIGQEATVKASAILNQSFKAKIKSISLAAKEQKEYEKSRVEFSVLMEILENTENLKPGMSVIADVVTYKVDRVLTLKHEFIQKENDRYFVTTESGVKKEIETGTQNEEMIEIKKGLNEGEKVQLVDFLTSSSTH